MSGFKWGGNYIYSATDMATRPASQGKAFKEPVIKGIDSGKDLELVWIIYTNHNNYEASFIFQLTFFLVFWKLENRNWKFGLHAFVLFCSTYQSRARSYLITLLPVCKQPISQISTFQFQVSSRNRLQLLNKVFQWLSRRHADRNGGKITISSVYSKSVR